MSSRYFSHFLPNWFEYHVDHTRNLWWLYAVRILHDLAEKVALFFVPIFVFQQQAFLKVPGLNATNNFQHGMVLVGVYYLLFRFTALVMLWPIGQLISKIGYRSTMIVSHLLYAVYFGVLYGATVRPELIFLAAIVHALRFLTFWISFDVLVSKGVLKSHLGQDLGALQFLLELATILAPAMGGVIVMTLGYQSLFMVALVFVTMSLIAAVNIKPVATELTLSLKKIKLLFKQSLFQRQAMAAMGKYAHDSLIIVWPIYILLTLGSIDRVGYIQTFSLFIALITTFFMGMYIDSTRGNRSFMMSSLALVGLNLTRFGVATGWGVALVDSLNKLIGNFHWLFFESLRFKAGKGEHSLDYFLSREIAISIGAIIFWTAFILFFILLPWPWQVVFVLAAVGVLVSSRMNGESPF